MPNQGGSIHLEPVHLSDDSLDPRHVFLVDGGLRIYVWYGTKCKNLLKSKARLMAEKINKNERKDKAVIKIFIQGHEPTDFWQILSDLDVTEGLMTVVEFHGFLVDCEGPGFRDPVMGIPFFRDLVLA